MRSRVASIGVSVCLCAGILGHALPLLRVPTSREACRVIRPQAPTVATTRGGVWLTYLGEGCWDVVVVCCPCCRPNPCSSRALELRGVAPITIPGVVDAEVVVVAGGIAICRDGIRPFGLMIGLRGAGRIVTA